MPKYFAHSANASGVKHELAAHLRAVATQARGFADKFAAGDLGYWLGLWHDLGKFNPDFQSYLSDPANRRGPDHSSAGMVHSAGVFEPMAFAVAGHHAGLPDRSKLKQRLAEKVGAPEIARALEIARQELPDLLPPAGLASKLPPFASRSIRAAELFLRVLFGALVDADFLDTEAHFNGQKSQSRAGAPSIDDLAGLLDEFQSRQAGDATPLNRARDEIYHHCLEAADGPAGIYRLTVPTGGGKTRSGMAFAMRHALRHGLDRVIVAIPYTSIIDQTAEVYRSIFGDVIVEHHSAVELSADSDDPVTESQQWPRLATENWDAPLVVTTTVQLFESLFARKPSACRKLHNIARSVLILDEVQTLPSNLLEPILDVLRELAENYGVTIVLCTATQPALVESPYVKGFRDVRDIVPDAAKYFSLLKRVDYECSPVGEKWPWPRAADEMRTSPQALAIVNTKRDALALLDVLGDQAALHLSTQMCGAHRKDTLKEIRRRLAVGEPCRLVSTQIVEAGVDIDFPLVLRAIGPLDRIVQAAGRCNREGKVTRGRVVVFDPQDGSSPPGVYRSGTGVTETLFREGRDLDDPATHEAYFRRLFMQVELDSERIQQSRERLAFETVATDFRMIDDDCTSIVVKPRGYRAEVESLLGRARAKSEPPRYLFRRLQPFFVNVRAPLLAKYERERLAEQVIEGLWVWNGKYDDVRGLVHTHLDERELVI